MNPSLVAELLEGQSPTLRILYGVATGANTVLVAGSTVAVVLPALSPVANGDFVAVLATGADRLILGRVGGGSRVVAYAQITADSSQFSSLTLIPGLSVTFTAVADRRYKMSFECEVVQTVGGDVWVFNMEDTAVTLKRVTGRNATTNSVSISASYSNNASITGSKTWRINGVRASGSGNIQVGAAATYPAFVLVEDIGPL